MSTQKLEALEHCNYVSCCFLASSKFTPKKAVPGNHEAIHMKHWVAWSFAGGCGPKFIILSIELYNSSETIKHQYMK